jgi:hypothetical protein
VNRLRRQAQNLGIAPVDERDSPVGIEHAQTLGHAFDRVAVQRELCLERGIACRKIGIVCRKIGQARGLVRHVPSSPQVAEQQVAHTAAR